MRDKNRETLISVNFHRTWLNNIKKNVKECVFISHVNYKGSYGVKVVMKNTSGGKDTITIPINVEPNKLTSADYRSILTMLKEKTYEQ